MKLVNVAIRGSVLRGSVLLAVVLSAAVLFAQHNKTSSAPKSAPAPAPHASASAHNPPQNHSTGNTQHTNTQHPNGNMNRGGNNSNMGHSNGNTMGRTGNMNNGRGNTSGMNNNRGAMNNNNRGGMNNNMGRNNTMGHNGGMNAGRPGAHVAPGRQVELRGGGHASIRPNGQIRSVNRNGMHIERGVRGERHVVSMHNGARVVTVGHRGGYVQRTYVVRGGHSYYSRTYYYHGVYRTGVYRGYYYGGRPYYGYYPVYYYQPVYYGWAYNPWPAPVYYGWGWGGAPWYGYYGPYYAPYPVYPSAAFWLTDFMIAASLQAAYEAQAASAWLGPNAADGTLVASLVGMPADAAPAKMSPEVKNALSEEVKATIAQEQADAAKGNTGANASGGQPANSNEAPPALNPKFRTFLISSDVSLVGADNNECSLSQGDVIERTTDTPDDDGNVNVKVVASSKNDCALGTEGPVSTDDLQEMYNSFREQMKDGMADLAKKQGSGGLPKAPDTSTTSGDVPAPPPDKSVEKTLQDQQSAADQTESDVKQEAGSNSGGTQ